MTMSEFKAIVPEALSRLTICLTGYSGYIGGHLVKTLVQAGIRPFLIGRPNTELNVPNGTYVASNWVDSKDLARQLADLPEVVIINIAGYFIGNHNSADIQSLVSGNIEFPIKIFEALALSGHKRIVNIGTSWEYSGNGANEPQNLYAQLKASNAATLEWYAKKFGLKALNLKLNDTYGGCDPRKKLLPYLYACSKTGEIADLHARASRINLLHIVDIQEGLFAAALRTSDIAPGSSETAFLLSGETLTIGELAEQWIAKIVPNLRVKFRDNRLNNPDLRDVLWEAPVLTRWKPRISLQSGLANYFKGLS